MLTVEWNGTLPTMSDTPAATTLTFSNGNTISGSAALTSFEPSTPLEDKMTARATFSFTGALS